MAEISFSYLKKMCKQAPAEGKTYKLGVMGDCATQHFVTALRGYAKYDNVPLEIFEADYNQIDAQTADPDSALYAFKPDAVLIYMCAEKLAESFYALPTAARRGFAANTMEKIRAYWSSLAANCSATVLQFNFVYIDDACFGCYAQKTDMSLAFQLQKLNMLLAECCQTVKNVYLVDLNGVQARLGRQHSYDSKMYLIARMPLSLEAFPEVAKRVIDTIKALRGTVKKCVVTDLDNTLWGGVIGDDGINEIQIGELGSGRAYTQLQTWLRELKSRGIILAVCSKNNEDTAKEPFLKHPDMTLRLDDFSMFVANWEDKATNIRRIKETLNIGMDSIVFIDDNPFERNAVKSLIPELTVPELPEDPSLYTCYLQEQNLFETASLSAEDVDRTKQYRAEAERASLQTSFGSYDEYLSQLEMVAEAKPFDRFHYPRIAQLTQRSNQFNLRTVRYTEAQIESVAEDAGRITRYYTLKDKFGDYGLISVVIMEKRDSEELFIDTWLMSCRVLKRGMEEFIINDLLRTARKTGYKKVIGEYIKTPKNSMVETVYERLGFKREGALFVAEADSFIPNKSYIVTEE